MEEADNLKPTHWRLVAIAAATIAVVGIPAIIILLTSSHTTIPTSITAGAGFPIYYPSPMPSSYDYQKSSAMLQNGIVVYKLRNHDNSVTINEQVAPPNPPDLNHLPGFKNLDVPAGNGAIGQSLGQTVAIILTNTTLVTISADKSVPSDIVRSFATSLSSLKH